MKTLQDLITEKFNAGEGEQDLRLTVLADNHTNLEVQIGEGKYTVAGDVLRRVDAGTVQTEAVSAGATTEVASAGAIESAGSGLVESDVQHEQSGLVENETGEAFDPKFTEILQHFGADDVQHVGEALNNGADLFQLLRDGEVVETGTLAELEALVLQQRSATPAA